MPIAGTIVHVPPFVLTRLLAIFNLTLHKVGLKGQTTFHSHTIKKGRVGPVPRVYPKVSLLLLFPRPVPNTPLCLSAQVPELLALTLNWELLVIY